MPELALDARAGQRAVPGGMAFAVRAGIIVAFALLVILSFTHNVNWDEFYFLSHIHAYLDGRLDRPMQTFFVHGFGWLDHIPGHEMQQILAARIVMVGFLGVTALSVHRIARHHTDAACANIAVLAFLASGFVLPHGASFRADPIAAALLTSAIAILLTTRLSPLQIIAAAGLSALALLVTIKAALYLPVFLATLIWRLQDRRIALRILGAGLLSAGIWAALYLWHASGIVAAPGIDTGSDARNALNTTLLNSGLLPRATESLTWAILSVAQIALAMLGLLGKRDLRRGIVLLLFAAPLLSVVIYRNAFAYFFPFAVPLLMVAVAFGAQRLQHARLLSWLVMIMMVSAGLQTARSFAEDTATQRATIAEVHRLFETPVPYIDDSGMIASFPSVGFFMSGWGVTRYRAEGTPVFADLIAQARPPLLIANKQTLIQTMGQAGSGSAILLPEDHRVLRQTYVHYSGPIWLAGRKLTLGPEPTPLRAPFPGRYRIETDVPVRIDGRVVTFGEVVAFDETPVTLMGPPGTPITLIWDTGVDPIQRDLPSDNIYFGFWGFQF